MAGWTKERIEKLKQLWVVDGLSASDCAARLGGFGHCGDGGRSSVIGKVHRLGLHRGSDTPRKNGGRKGGWAVSNERRKKKAAPPQRVAIKPASAPVFAAAEPIGPIEEVYIPPHERKQILDLEMGDCKWPIGHVGNSEFHFCGRKQVKGLPYCEDHARRAFVPQSLNRSRKPVERHFRIVGGEGSQNGEKLTTRQRSEIEGVS